MDPRAERILDAAGVLIDASGSFAMQDVAARARVSLTTVYRLFDGKAGILLALARRRALSGAAWLEGSLLAGISDSRERLRLAVTWCIETAAGNLASLEAVNVMAAEERALDPTSVGLEYRATEPFVEFVRTEIERGVASGVFHSRDPELDAVFVTDVIERSVYRLVFGLVDRSPDAVADHAWRFVARALTPSADHEADAAAAAPRP